MHKLRVLGLLLLVGVFGAAAVWALTRGAIVPEGAAPLANAAPDESGRPLDAKGGERGDAGGQPAERTAVAPSAGKAAAGGFAIVGQVLDDAGHPLAAAVVSALAGPALPFGPGGRGRSNGPGGLADFDLESFDPADFDPAALIERVRTQQAARVQVTTDEQGRFRLAPPGQGGEVFMRIAARGHLMLDRSAPRPVGADTDLGALSLKRGAIVTGRVLDRSSQPIADAKVARRGREEGRMGLELEFPGADLLEGLRDGDGGVTDAEGRFELLHVVPGEFALRARHVDHPVARKDGLNAKAGETLSDVIVVMEPGALISGKIVGVPDGTTGLRVQASAKQSGAAAPAEGRIDFTQMLGDAREALADLGMAIGEKSSEVGAERTFTLRGLEVGKTYRVWVARTGRGFAGGGVCSEPKDVPAGSVGQELRYDPGITVTCRVVDSSGDAPVERLWVGQRLQGGGGGGLQDLMGGFMPGTSRAKDYPDGRVTLTDLRPKKSQTLRLSIEASGYAALVREGIALPSSGNLDLGTVKLTRAPVVRVLVTAAADGAPLAGVSVRLQQKREPRGAPDFGSMMDRFGGRLGAGGPGSARTDASGRCVLNGTPGATATLAVSSKEHAPYEKEISMPAEKDCEHEARLVSGGSVEVSVVDADGKPLAKTSVDHAPPEGRRDNRTTGPDGRVTFERLAPGSHRFRIGDRRGGGMDFGGFAMQFGASAPPTDDAAWETVAVADGARAELRLAKRSTASLRGIVRENGAPLAGARVAFVQGASDGNDASTDQALAGVFAELNAARGRSVRTGEDGSYSISELPSGQHRLRVTHQGRVMPTVIPLPLRLGENVVDVALEANVVRGTVRDPQGKPVASATVVVRRAGGSGGEDPLAQFAQGMPGLDLGAMAGNRASVKTAADGTYELRGVASGVRLQVAASAKGFARATSAELEVSAGSTREGVDVQLGAAGSIAVTAAGGGMFQAARATFVDADGKPDPAVAPAMQMLRRGAGTIDGLRPGRWKVELTGANGTAGEPRFVDVVAGEVAKVSL